MQDRSRRYGLSRQWGDNHRDGLAVLIVLEHRVAMTL